MRLSAKLSIAIILTLAAIGLVAGPAMVYLQVKTIRAHYANMAESLADLLQDRIEFEMIAADRERITESVIQLSGLANVNQVTIFNEQGAVYAWGKGDERGQERLDPEVLVALRTGATISGEQTRFGQLELHFVRPLLNKPQCYACHGVDRPVLGAVGISMDLTPLSVAIRREVMTLVTTGVLTLLAIGLVLTTVLRRTVLDRLSRLSGFSRRISSGDYSGRLKEESQDELGEVARTLNGMAQEVQRTALGLEESVQQRTRELSGLVKVITAIHRHLELDQMLAEALRTVSEVSDADAVAIFLPDTENADWWLKAHRGLTEAEALALAHRPEAGPGQGPQLGVFPVEAGAALRMRGEVRGWIVAARRQSRPFPHEFPAFLQAVAEPLGMAIEKSQLHIEVEEQDLARGELLKRTVLAQEEERRRVAREVRGELTERLTAVLDSIALVESALPPGSPDQGLKLRQAWTVGQQALAHLQKLATDLRPEVLDTGGLVPALGHYMRETLEPLGIASRLEHRGLEQRLPASVELSLYRVLQEALANIARHARATSVLVSLEKEDSTVSILVEDDGRGFEAARVRRGPGALGLRGMEERIAPMGGTLAIDSRPGGGTRVRIRVPLRPEAGDGTDASARG